MERACVITRGLRRAELKRLASPLGSILGGAGLIVGVWSVGFCGPCLSTEAIVGRSGCVEKYETTSSLTRSRAAA